MALGAEDGSSHPLPAGAARMRMQAGFGALGKARALG